MFGRDIRNAASKIVVEMLAESCYTNTRTKFARGLPYGTAANGSRYTAAVR